MYEFCSKQYAFACYDRNSTQKLCLPCSHGPTVLLTMHPRWLIIAALDAWDSRFSAATHSLALPQGSVVATKCASVTDACLACLAPAPALMHNECCRPNVRDYEPVFDLRGQSDIEVAKELTGRTYIPTNYWLDVVPDTATRGLQVCRASFYAGWCCHCV